MVFNRKAVAPVFDSPRNDSTALRLNGFFIRDLLEIDNILSNLKVRKGGLPPLDLIVSEKAGVNRPS